MLTIWGRSDSSNVQAVVWAVGELGLAYERRDVGHRFGGLDTPEFAALNPNRLIPVLRDGAGEPIWETGAILRYLAARYGSELFWPRDPVARADVDKWAEWAKVSVAAAFTGPVFWAVVRTPPSRRDPAALGRALATLGQWLEIADARLERSAFLASDAFTLADVSFGSLLYRYFELEIARRDLPALGRYYGRLRERPAFQEHVMVSYEALRAFD
jgi:glutathione S-transferase